MSYLVEQLPHCDLLRLSLSTGWFVLSARQVVHPRLIFFFSIGGTPASDNFIYLTTHTEPRQILWRTESDRPYRGYGLSQRVFRCDRGVERENLKICGIFFTSVQVTPILNTAYAAMLKDTSGGTCIIWKSENIANHHFVHIHCYMLLSLQVSNNWPTDYLPLKISSISDRSFFRYGFRGL